MKIAIIAHNKFPIKEPYAGGLEMITHLLVTSLMQRGHNVDLFALKDSDPDFKIIPLDSEEILNSNTSEAAMAMDDLMYENAIQQIEASNYDMVHNHSMNRLPIQWGANTANRSITSFHTPVFKDIHIGLASIKPSENQQFTMVSKRLGQEYSKLVSEYEVIYNGIESAKWKFSSEAKKDQVCWIGRICKEKAPHTAINLALKAGKKIILAGPISNEVYYNEFLVEKLEHENVTYLGHLKQDELNDLIRASEMLLFTSVWEEPYGLVLAEALACGTPVVSWKVGAAPEILTEKTGVLVDPFDENNFIKAIRTAEKLNRKDCRHRAENFCDVKKMVDDYENLYCKLSKKDSAKELLC